MSRPSCTYSGGVTACSSRHFSGHRDRTPHAPVIDATPTGAVEGVCTGLVERQGEISRLARFNIHGGLVALTDGETVHNIVRSQAQVQGLTSGNRQVGRCPAARFRHAGVQGDGVHLSQPPGNADGNAMPPSRKMAVRMRASFSFMRPAIPSGSG